MGFFFAVSYTAMSIDYPQLCVGAIVFHNDAVLLVKRHNPPNAGQWAIPGGKVHFGETLQQAAEREILEETGIHIKAGDCVYQFEVIEKNAADQPTLHYVIIDLSAEYRSGTPHAVDDAADAGWISRELFATLDINVTTRKLLKYQYAFP